MSPEIETKMHCLPAATGPIPFFLWLYLGHMTILWTDDLRAMENQLWPDWVMWPLLWQGVADELLLAVPLEPPRMRGSSGNSGGGWADHSLHSRSVMKWSKLCHVFMILKRNTTMWLLQHCWEFGIFFWVPDSLLRNSFILSYCFSGISCTCFKFHLCSEAFYQLCYVKNRVHCTQSQWFQFLPTPSCFLSDLSNSLLPGSFL